MRFVPSLAAVVAGVLFSALAIGSAAAQVDAHEPDPVKWLRSVYDLYLKSEGTDTETNADYDLVIARASKQLAALFKKNKDCEVKAGGICALDWDFVIDGQDYRLKNVRVGKFVAKGDRGTVTVSFINMSNSCANVYDFVREDGEWKVDDIETRSGKDKAISIAKLLRDFKE